MGPGQGEVIFLQRFWRVRCEDRANFILGVFIGGEGGGGEQIWVRSISRFTEHRTVLAYFMDNKMGISRFT